MSPTKFCIEMESDEKAGFEASRQPSISTLRHRITFRSDTQPHSYSVIDEVRSNKIRGLGTSVLHGAPHNGW